MNGTRVHGIRSSQKGSILTFLAITAVVIIGMGGLAVDLGHAYWNKNRLQNVLDAAALSGAKTLNETGSLTQADQDARSTFQSQLTGEMTSLTPTITFSPKLYSSPNFLPAASADASSRYIRVKVAIFTMPVWLARVVPGIGKTLSIGGTAVAGPQYIGGPGSTVCNIAPMVMCTDDSHLTCDSSSDCLGYNVDPTNDVEQVLKTGSGTNWNVGPGNYQLIQLDCGSGGSCVRQEIGGSYSGCATVGNDVTTKPGNTVGPVSQGLNTRFGIYNGPVNSTDYPPDHVTHYSTDSTGTATFWYGASNPPGNPPDPSYSYSYGNQDQYWNTNGVDHRRMIAVPVANCTGTTNGQGNVDVLGLACMFLTQPAANDGSQTVYGQLVGMQSGTTNVGETGACDIQGTPSATPPPGSPLYKIVLYKDPTSWDS